MYAMRFEGGTELARNLNALPVAVSARICMAVLKLAAHPIQERATQLAPHAPGEPDLRDNIGISAASRLGSTEGGRWRAREEGEFAVAIGPTKDFFYGLFQEYGTVRHGAQPFMRPAFDSEAPKALGIIGRELWIAIRATIRPVQAPSVGSTTPAFGGGRFGLPMAA